MIIEKCRELLRQNLRELVQGDYILLDLPYYLNVGDVLIWQSTIDLLEELPYRCLYSSSIESYRKPQIDENVIILFMGGGNFGDLWIRHQYFRYRVMEEFPNNPIIQLPQSVYFNDNSLLLKDVELFASHQASITICLREQKSYDLVVSNYKGVKVRLIPDMVLGLDINRYTKIKEEGNGILFVERNDIEKRACNIDNCVPKNAVRRDWPTMEEQPQYIKVYNNIQLIINRIDKALSTNLSQRLADFCFKHVFKKKIIKSGVDFLAPYEEVYSTRLHTAILAVLMDKKVVAFDNSYGKIKGVYNLWMKDLKNFTMK